jgi:glycosyltransferase involved in cell wall biosynthesis
MKKGLVALGLLAFFFFPRVLLSNTTQTKIWSILICTLEERTECFAKIYNKLQSQIEAHNLKDQVEILFFKDNREQSIGFKRNSLLKESHGEYVCFVDDDDVHDLYISMIYEKLAQKPDCVSLVGIMTTQGRNPEIFLHSIRYNNKYCTENGIHFRPPNHLNPIKRSIAIQFSFPENNFGEDRQWALALKQSGLLKNEAVINVPYYFYQYDGKYHTQPVKSSKPRVSIITSVYKGDEFIEEFLKDIVRQTIFKECELIIINANSPGNEEPLIKRYTDLYPNIIYERLSFDPGLYAVWNYAIKKAKSDLITNSNIDDRRNPQSLEMHARALEEDHSIDVVYSNVYLTFSANETFEKNSHYAVMQPDEFSPERMYKCLPGPLPMWRKSLHSKFGFFDETYLSAGDFEFWNRLTSHGVRFKKVPGISGLFYQNPRGLSTDKDALKAAQRDCENKLISQRYGYLWRR